MVDREFAAHIERLRELSLRKAIQQLRATISVNEEAAARLTAGLDMVDYRRLITLYKRLK